MVMILLLCWCSQVPMASGEDSIPSKDDKWRSQYYKRWEKGKITRIWPSSPPTIKLHTPNLVFCSTDYSTSSRLPNLLKKKYCQNPSYLQLSQHFSLRILRWFPWTKFTFLILGFKASSSCGLYLYHLSGFIYHDRCICLVHLNPLCLISSLLLILSSWHLYSVPSARNNFIALNCCHSGQ